MKKTIEQKTKEFYEKLAIIIYLERQLYRETLDIGQIIQNRVESINLRKEVKLLSIEIDKENDARLFKNIEFKISKV